MTRNTLGYGIGLRVQHFPHYLEHGVTGLDWLEVISENFFEPGGRPQAVLERVRADVPIVLHGVSLGIGNTAPMSSGYLHSLAALIKRIEPPLVSDHLCWGGVAGKFAHDLLPLPYTEQSLKHVVERVGLVQERIGRELVLENPSTYVAFAENTIPEWEFLAEVAKRSGCGVLLDVNNIFVSAFNHGFSAETYLDSIPAEKIRYVHLAGHTDYGSYLLDSHIGPTPDPVWRLYGRLIQRIGRISTLIEWDEQVPEFEVVAAEARQASSIAKEALRAA